ncbi:winged helix-turn-helix domain-containing protein [Segnochrobactraceae bacterium EtOH-i3]
MVAASLPKVDDAIRPAGICPCCGGPVEPDEIIMDLSGNLLSYRGSVIVLPPSEAEVMAALVAAFPGTITNDKLINAVWGGYDAPLAALHINKVRICNLRKRIAAIGLGILTIWSTGYRLVRIEEAC